MVVQSSNAPDESSDIYLCAPNGTKTTLPPTIYERMWVSGVNDQQWIVGDQSYYENDPITGQEKHLGYEKPEDDFDDEADPGKKRKGRGTLGFIWGAGSSL